jgi:hypothetical protein
MGGGGGGAREDILSRYQLVAGSQTLLGYSCMNEHPALSERFAGGVGDWGVGGCPSQREAGDGAINANRRHRSPHPHGRHGGLSPAPHALSPVAVVVVVPTCPEGEGCVVHNTKQQPKDAVGGVAREEGLVSAVMKQDEDADSNETATPRTVEQGGTHGNGARYEHGEGVQGKAVAAARVVGWGGGWGLSCKHHKGTCTTTSATLTSTRRVIDPSRGQAPHTTCSVHGTANTWWLRARGRGNIRMGASVRRKEIGSALLLSPPSPRDKGNGRSTQPQPQCAPTASATIPTTYTHWHAHANKTAVHRSLPTRAHRRHTVRFIEDW